ncbi:unnamed protein product [Victoria cruziana]
MARQNSRYNVITIAEMAATVDGLTIGPKESPEVATLTIDLWLEGDIFSSFWKASVPNRRWIEEAVSRFQGNSTYASMIWFRGNVVYEDDSPSFSENRSMKNPVLIQFRGKQLRRRLEFFIREPLISAEVIRSIADHRSNDHHFLTDFLCTLSFNEKQFASRRTESSSYEIF